jgi:nuclear pore complex protein Nup205
VLATLLGETSTDDGIRIPNVTIFDLFDFAELDIGGGLGIPVISYFADLDFEICIRQGPDGCSVYDLRSVEQLLALQQRPSEKPGNFKTQVKTSKYIPKL